jgi:hypothetical protein
MKLGTFDKQPNEKRRYGVSYKDVLEVGDAIISATAVVEPANELAAATEFSSDFLNVICTGGVDGTKYKVTVTVTTTANKEIFEDELFIKVREI